MSDFRKNPVVQAFYSVPYLQRAYHFIVSFLAALFYRLPGRKLIVIGVTGTKGKSSVVELLGFLLESSGRKTARLSSVQVTIGEKSFRNPTKNTMPGRFFIQWFLREAVKAGCTHAVIEVTSQGVLFSRHRFIPWKFGLLTNLEPEHIEAHGSFEKYRDSKLSFLRMVARQGGTVFLEQGGAHADFFLRSLPEQNIAFYSADDVKSADLENPVFRGDHAKKNVSAAVALARALHVSDQEIQKGLLTCKGVPGRMQTVEWPHGMKSQFEIVVDYAHTPESLKAAQKTLRKELDEKSGRLICVLGAAGGGRDAWKRPVFGKIAAHYCDYIILTDEDPYDEDSEEIISEIEKGIPPEKTDLVENILDRREAIARALSLAREGDAILLTGKGSETSIHGPKGKRIAWDEVKVVRELLSQRGSH